MSTTFKIGDRVVLVKDRDSARKGMKGTVVTNISGGDYGVKFDEKFDEGHSLDGSCDMGYGYWIAPSEMELIPKFEVGQVYKVGKLTYQHQWENAIVKITDYGSSFMKIKALRGDCPVDFMKDSEYARALTLLTGKEIGEAIRKWDEEHAEKKSGVREVKRHAKVGEYIKAISDDGHRVPIGDIVRVIDVDEDGWVGVSAIKYGCDRTVLRTEQYIVLEGYNPEQKQEHRKARVGDTIKVVSDGTECTAAHNGAIGKVVEVKEDKVMAKFPSFMDECSAPYSVAHGTYEIITSGKHSYTTEQIEKAKKLCGEIMAEAFDDGKTFNIRILDKNYDKKSGAVTCDIARFNGASRATGNAKCSDHDEYNVWIGRCVALCKALHKPIPKFITEG